MARFLRIVLPLLLCAAAARAPHAAEPPFADLVRQADAAHAQGAYRRALELYRAAERAAPDAAAKRWPAFRAADSLWRDRSATDTPDQTPLEEARTALERMVRDTTRREEKDLVWAEIQESLGDFHWTRRASRNWGAAWPFYAAALDWWAASPAVGTAAARYIGIVRKCASPPRERWEYYGQYASFVPPDIVENALRVARDASDTSFLNYLLAVSLSRDGSENWPRYRRTRQAFEAALRAGKSSEWHDDALYQYARWALSSGAVAPGPDGRPRRQPDYPGALRLFRELLRTYAKGETRWYEEAERAADEIVRPAVSVSVPSIFQPGSEIGYHISWRNVRSVECSLYRVELARDIRFSEKDSSWGWVQAVDTSRCEKVRTWTKETGDDGGHRPGSEALRAEPLPAGAYLLETRAGGVSAREAVLVTDAVLVVRPLKSRVLAYFCSVLDGAPIPGAPVRLDERFHDGSRYVWRTASAMTGADGTCFIPRADGRSHADIFVSAAAGDRTAFALGGTGWFPDEAASWKVYAFTDRPAYRPGETAQWKCVVRRLAADGACLTPAGQSVSFEIFDPRGAKVKDGKLSLNEFGGAWSEVPLTATMPLGEYRVRFRTGPDASSIGDAALFRLEEYRLPEFRVAVRTPEEKGRRRVFKVGERIEAVVSAEYYFGGPVPSADVEFVVTQRPFFPSWEPPREYPWLFETVSRGRFRSYGESVVKREKARTGADGTAVLSFEAPFSADRDFEFQIEARVTDASRREVVGRGTVRAARQGYYAYLRSDHAVHRVGGEAAISVRTLDADGGPVAAEGDVVVQREYWVESWVDADGSPVPAERVRSLVEGRRPPDPGMRMVSRGYRREEVLKTRLSTGAAGEGRVVFTPARHGRYVAVWDGRDTDGIPIVAETRIYAASRDVEELGIRSDGVRIVVDRESVRPGGTTPVILMLPAYNRHVLFCVEGNDLLSSRVLRASGNTRMVEIELDDRHSPNIFLTAVCASDGTVHADTAEIVVPPVKRYLDVAVSADRAEYRPGGKGLLKVSARTADGRPARAEVALAFVDESVYAIQDDLAGDPRSFFFGTKRSVRIQTLSTTGYRPFARKREAPPAEVEPGFAAFGRGGAAGAFTMAAPAPMMEAAQAGADRAEVMSRRSSVAEDKLSVDGSVRKAAGMNAAREEGAGEPAVVVRTDFRSTILWRPAVVTDEDGIASVEVRFPDSLTSWKAVARAAGAADSVGTAESSARTSLPLVARLQTPRFLVAGDRAAISCVVVNNTDAPVDARVSLAAEGVAVEAAAGKAPGAPANVTVPARGETRVEWMVRADAAAAAVFRAAAVSPAESDAMERRIPVHEHGIEKFLAASGRIAAGGARVSVDLPAARRPGSAAMTIRIAPSLALTMLDALPYLIDYPYGCTEQTMSRFLPAAVAARTLSGLGLAPEDVAHRAFGGIEPAAAERTHAEGRKDIARLDDMVAQGLRRLADFQHADGGWGWWKEGETDRFMTAYVLWGLALARDAGVSVDADVVRRAAAFLDTALVKEEEQPDMQAWLLHAVAAARPPDAADAKPSKFQAAAFENLWKRRDSLNAFTRALLTLSAAAFGEAAKARTLAAALENGVSLDERPDASVVLDAAADGRKTAAPATAHWGSDAVSRRWSDGGVETTAFVLRALLAADPKNAFVQPAALWLVKNRRGAQWSNTRDTAIVVLSLTDYLRRSGELATETEYEVAVNGRSLGRRTVKPARMLDARSDFPVPSGLLKDGANEVRIIRRSGSGPLYYAVETRFFSREEPIPAAGSEMFVRREYYRLKPVPTLLKGTVHEKIALPADATTASGDRMEVVVTVDSKNDAEYLVFEDLKPAGLEAVDLKSGGDLYARELTAAAARRKFAGGSAEMEPSDYTGRTRWVYRELRDRTVSLFVDKLPQGIWEIRYILRGETPGRFHALPVLGHAMYVPEIRANSAEQLLQITP